MADAIRAKTQQLRDLVAQAQADRCDYWAAVGVYQASMAQIMDVDIGPIFDLANQIDGLLPAPKAEPPPVEPPPPQWADPRTYLRGWSAAAHWAGSREGRYAVDWYPAALGTDFGWIEGGKTRGYGMVGPLFVPAGGHDCFNDPSIYRPTQSGCLEVEWAPDDWREVPEGHIFLPANSTLWTLVLDLAGGQEMVSFTHVLKEAKVGATVARFEPFVKVGDSGLEMFTARGQNAAHVHFAAMIGGQQYGVWQGGMGNTPAWEYLLAKGFTIRQKATVPSPQDYINGYVNREPY